MTAKTMKDEVQHYLALGAAAVIPKPFDPLTLTDQLQEIWTQR
jgi:CheY-like chemotaxis protein